MEWIILISFIILTATYFGLSIVSKYLHIQQIYIVIILVSTMVTLIFIGIGMTVFIVGHLSKVKADYELQQISERNAYINGLEEKNNELRRFKHDYKNFLLSLSASIENNQDDSEIVQRLLNYADVNLKNDTKPSDANLYKINDKLIRGIIITKVMIARDKGIQTNVEIAENVEIAQKFSIDITRILGILFDNAIEASLKNPKPELDFALISYDESVEFVFKNNVDPTATIEMSKLYDLGYSTKSNHNGLGLATVKKIVNSNKNFLLQTKFKNSKFSTVLTSMKK
ncbi:sensor histidine kinase [Companilactobacillus mindensis]|nr:GHKL domain-containing protein [Companilactobacillus mindensis]